MEPSTASNALEQRTLPELMATLPQELYEQIYDEVVTTHPRAVAVGYPSGEAFARPIPALLQVSRGVREHVLGSYYANTTFICHVHAYSPEEFFAFHFPESHLSESRIRSIRLYKTPGGYECSHRRSATALSWYLKWWRDACGHDTKIVGYYWEDQLYAALAREDIKVCEMASMYRPWTFHRMNPPSSASHQQGQLHAE
ncbi:hypothetical protein AC578_674 [Pseudocercospora eumusae]|uniref:Uncharacterized protein n=1 Tax=Pseudocercospora eumusae TaxID=321146 RepID=A0A139HKW4_9PEZI|nr:hypothetical protein AC578_674 [Pseudocercospora eumusae]